MLYRDLTRRLDPWREMDHLQQRINRAFQSFPGFTRQSYPSVNVWSNPESMILTAELPGYNRDNIAITIKGNEVTLKGSRTLPQMKEKDYCHRQERVFGDFERTVQLPYVIDENKVEANLKNGVLHITLPRAEEDKPKNIEIKS